MIEVHTTALHARHRNPRCRTSASAVEATPPPRVELDAPAKIRDVAETVRQSPHMLAADATLERLTLARNADVLATAVEAAQDVGAVTGPEKMLSHQLAAAHKVGMGMFAVASDEIHKYRVRGT